MEKQTTYHIISRESGDIIEEAATFQEAVKIVDAYLKQDRLEAWSHSDGIGIDDIEIDDNFYQIVEV